MSRDTLLDEAIAKAKADGDVQIAEWLRQARGANAAARWYTEKLRDLEDENARLRSCLSDDADNARQIMGENAKLRELCADLYDHAAFSIDYFGDAHGILPRMRELGIEVDA